MVVDCFTWNGEHELFDLHYEMLKGVVDEFIVVEFDKTFAGEKKKRRFSTIPYEKVNYHFIQEEQWSEYLEMAKLSPNTIGASHWLIEFAQKESIKDTLTHLKDNDVVFIGDVDEIWSPEALQGFSYPLKLKLDVYTYYLNNRSTEQFWGTTVAPYGVIRETCLNHLRTSAPRSRKTLGWHFTSMGGPAALTKKLTDSYTQESYATPEVLANIEYNIEHQRDFLGRDFSYTLDESNWPEFLMRNRGKYEHLCK